MNYTLLHNELVHSLYFSKPSSSRLFLTSLLFRPKKTQRLREEVALGQQTTHTHTSTKTWHAINTETILEIAEKVESITSLKNTETISPISWITEIAGNTVLSENITTAHQQLVSERDRHVCRYNTQLELAVNVVLSYYNTVLLEEEKWTERWHSQIEMLNGKEMH
jgi:hypothetical protein